MELPFFSIVVPTRNRYETLRHTIATVVMQKFSSFELVISDNSDMENLSQLELIKDTFLDQRVKYYRPPTVLSMTDHWEFAVSKAIGDFVILFGDDDGLVEGALDTIYVVIQRTKTNLVSWARVEYSWPDRLPYQISNQMTIPYKAKSGIMNGKKYIKSILRGSGDYRYLPMLYNSAISRDLIHKSKKQTGRLFNAVSPDIYTGFAFANLVKEYITIGSPLSINGVSAKSNGAAHLNEDEQAKIDFWKLLEKSDIRWPKTLPKVMTAYTTTIEPFVQLIKHCPELSKYITRKKIYRIIIDTLEGISVDDYRNKLNIIIESANDDKSLQKWVERYVLDIAPKVSQKPTSYENRIGFDGSHLILDASKFGLKNVYDVSVFVSNIFGEMKKVDFEAPINPNIFRRIRRALGIIKNGF